MPEIDNASRSHAIGGDSGVLPIDGNHALITVRSSYTVREPSVIINDRDRGILTLVAQGLDTQEISDHLGIPKPQVHLMLRNIRNELGVASSFGAVMAAIEQGQLDTNDLVPPDFDPSVFESLTLNEKKTLSAFIANGDSVSDGKLAFALETTVEGFTELMGAVVNKLGARNRTQAAVLFHHVRREKQDEARSRGVNKRSVDVFKPSEARGSEKGILSPREIDVLSLRAQGFTNKEIGEKLEISEQTVKNHMGSIMRKLNAPKGANAILEAEELGILDLQSLIPLDFDPSVFSRLSPTQRKLLMIFVNSRGTALNKELSQTMEISEHTVKNHISGILRRTGARDKEQVLVFYLEAKRRAREEAIVRGEDPEQAAVFGTLTEESEEIKKERKTRLSPRGIDMLSLRAQGFTNKEIGEKLEISEQTVKNTISNSILKKLDSVCTIQAIVRAIEGGYLNLSELVPRNFRPAILNDLTQAEMRVLENLVNSQGVATNYELARDLGILESTVKKHMTEILKKTRARNRTQVVVFFLEAQRRSEEARTGARLGRLPMPVPNKTESVTVYISED